MLESVVNSGKSDENTDVKRTEAGPNDKNRRWLRILFWTVIVPIVVPGVVIGTWWLIRWGQHDGFFKFLPDWLFLDSGLSTPVATLLASGGVIIAAVIAFRNGEKTRMEERAKWEESKQQETVRSLRDRYFNITELLAESSSYAQREAAVYSLVALSDDWASFYGDGTEAAIREQQTCLNVIVGQLRDPLPDEDDHEQNKERSELIVFKQRVQGVIAERYLPFSSSVQGAWSCLDLNLSFCHLYEPDFTKCVFARKVLFNSANFIGSVIFRRAHFNNGADFQDATFNRRANFWGVTFHGRTNFQGAHFNNGVTFRRAHFNNGADFQDATFNRRANLRRAHFNNGADFQDATFNRRANFRGVTFHGRADFQDATFNGTDFWKTTFDNGANFRGAHFHGRTKFQIAHFHGRTHFTGAYFDGDTYFRDATFHGRADFRGATFQGRANFRGAKFLSYAVFGETEGIRARQNHEDRRITNTEREGAVFKQSPSFDGPSQFDQLSKFNGTQFPTCPALTDGSDPRGFFAGAIFLDEQDSKK